METIITQIPVTEIQVGDEVLRSSSAVTTTDKVFYITVTRVHEWSSHHAEVSYEINGETYSKDYPIDGFVFVKRQDVVKHPLS